MRVHTDGQADAASRALDAHAFTAGGNIAFRRGAYEPDSGRGRQLLAHELTHVVQNRNGTRISRQVSAPGDAAELEADRVADSVGGGKDAGPIVGAPSRIARQASPKPSTEYYEFEVEPGPPGKTILRSTQPTDEPKWVDRALTFAGYNIYLNGYMIWLDGTSVDGLGIHVPESDVDFITEHATPINNHIYDSRAEATAAVATARKPADGSLSFAYYWGAGGLVVAPTTFCPGTAPRATATMWQARQNYVDYVQKALGSLAEGILVFRVLGQLYGWASGGGGGRGPSTPRGGSPKLRGGGEEGTPPGGGAKPPALKPPGGEPSTGKAPAKPSEVKPPGAKPPEAKPPEVKPPGAKPPEAKPPEVKPPAASASETEGPTSGPDLFKKTAQAPGGQAGKVKYFEENSKILRQRTGWKADPFGEATDGSHVYYGSQQSKALVITRDGKVFTGTWGEHVKMTFSPSGPQLVCDWTLPGWKQW